MILSCQWNFWAQGTLEKAGVQAKYFLTPHCCPSFAPQWGNAPKGVSQAGSPWGSVGCLWRGSWGYARAEEGLGRSEVAPNVPRDGLIMEKPHAGKLCCAHLQGENSRCYSVSSISSNCRSEDETHQEVQSCSVLTWAADTGLIYFQRLSHWINPISVLWCFILYRKDCALILWVCKFMWLDLSE